MTPHAFEALMSEALAEARRAFEMGEVPVGAVIAIKGEIVARAHNRVETDHDASAHAELLAIREASSKISNWRLAEAVLCVTLEPCTMCLGAVKLARVGTVAYGARDPRLGAIGSLYDLAHDPRNGPVPRVIEGIQSDACRDILHRFFRERVRQEEGGGA